MLRHRAFAAAVLATATAGTAAVAQADDAPPAAPVLSAYRVTAEGSGTYERVNKSLHNGLGYEDHVAAAFSYNVVLPQVWFDGNGHVMSGTDGDVSGPAQGTFSGTASSHMVVHGMSGETPVTSTQDCTAPLQDVKPGIMRLRRAAGPQPPKGENVIVTPLSAIAFSADCTPAAAGNTINVWSDSGASEGILDQAFDLPQEATQMDKIIQLVAQRESQKNIWNCPGFVLSETVSCDFRWSGKITFDRVAKMDSDPVELDPEDLPELPAQNGSPAPSGTTPAPTSPSPTPTLNHTNNAKAAVTVSGSPRLDARRGTASVTVTCAAACRGSVAAYAPGAKIAKAKAKRAKPLATRRFTAPAGRPTKVTVKLSAKARRQLRGRHALTLVITVGRSRTAVTAR